MLWYKSWLETRVRVLGTIAVMAVVLAMVHSNSNAHTTSPSPGALTSFVSITLVYVMMVGAMFGAAGIATQPSFMVQRGIHGSTLFTLSLPVSRLRLLFIRAALGWVESIFVMCLFCAGAWFAYPWMRLTSTPFGMLSYATGLLACGSLFYATAVLLGSFLEDQWRVWGTTFVGMIFGFASRKFNLPAFLDIFHGMTNLMRTHAMPWSAMAFSLCVSAVLLGVTAVVVKKREY